MAIKIEELARRYGRDMKPRRVKVAGDRNTGTNVFEAVLTQHTNAVAQPSTVPVPIKRLATRLDSQAPTDAWFLATERFNGGWKHAEATRIAARLDQFPKRPIALVFLVRDPWSWLVSTYRRPYHWAGAGFDSFASFLETPMPTVRREYLGSAPTLTPPQAWNRKTRSAVHAAQQAAPAIVVRYEDVITDCDRTVADVCTALGLTQHSQAVLPGRGVKPDDLNVDASVYADRLRSGAHRDSFDTTTTSLVAQTLDQDLLTRLGYNSSLVD